MLAYKILSLFVIVKPCSIFLLFVLQASSRFMQKPGAADQQHKIRTVLWEAQTRKRQKKLLL